MPADLGNLDLLVVAPRRAATRENDELRQRCSREYQRLVVVNINVRAISRLSLILQNDLSAKQYLSHFDWVKALTLTPLAHLGIPYFVSLRWVLSGKLALRSNH